MTVSTVYYKLLGPAYTRTFRCLWMLEEVGCKYEIDQAFRPSSRKVTAYNSAGKVPVLLEYSSQTDKEPSFCLTESTAINTYLGQGTNLVPTEKHERATYDATIAYLLSEVDAPIWFMAKHTLEPLKQFFGALPDCVEPCTKELTRAHARLVPTLSPYLLGSTFTAADILYCHCLEWQRSTNKELILDDALKNYMRQCRERPAYQRAHAIRKSSQQITPAANL
ncbi:hypothetical protein MPSEU_000561100 [Mayamaea pseudoterrestris]|nr:hypothetical protein MPSEU_000561100 [Mayamaea pseudoterrestris]